MAAPLYSEYKICFPIMGMCLCLDPIDLIFYRERASQPAGSRRKRHWRREMEGELKAEGRKADVTCFSRLIPPPPPAHHLGGGLARSVSLMPPSTLLGPAYDVILTIPAPFGASSQWPRPRGPKGAHLKEETKLNNFLLYGFLIEGLGAEQLAPKDRRKFSKYMRPPKILRSA